ncbi:MAG: hypothetical protein L6R40_001565 [Gallowayella cf. fulva]|nr:MAG: hypothetical protein L6R40_001565 [Xanthomendoza cf. fulva]
MATAVANKPAPPHQKMKRPPPPTVQTNGIKNSQSPSPSLAHKRLPSNLKQPPSGSAAAVNGANGTVNGANRLHNRRRDSQKPGDPQPRPNRSSKNSSIENNPDKRKRLAEPYVNMASHILKKYKNKQPSLIIHLHLTHFRFDQQDGSFSYSSPMKIILEHLRLQTVPHDMIEELNAAAVKFYEGADSQSSSSAPASDKNLPFSIHNYNEHLTPSPFAPYPKSATASGSSLRTENTQADAGKTDGESSQGKPTSQKAKATGPRIFTTVLFPTQQSVEEEVHVLANTPDPRSNNRKQSQASSSSRTPASATMPHPPTPLSAVPPTPAPGPSNKRQKMLLGEADMRNLQTKLTTSSAAPLYLEPTGSLEETSKLIQCLTDALHKENLPAPKTRKRTVAELEADEAQAASEQRFMLIMDERLAHSVAGSKAGAGDGETGAVVFDPRFERFKTIESIKAAHREKEQQLQEARAVQQAQIQAANKVKQEQVEQQKLFLEKKNAENAQREQQHIRAIQAIQTSQNAQQQKVTLAAMQQQQQQQQLAASQGLNGFGPTVNGVMSNQQPIPSNPQHQHSSPVSRQMTPHTNPRSSPLVGSNIPHSVPMKVTTSGQGVTSSPARPASAAQHGHPAGGVAMVARGSQQRPPSRMGTPSMPNGTPSGQHGTPVIKQGTPTPRMHQGSPPNSMQHTPMMNTTGFAAQHINGQPITPEMQERYQRERVHQMHIRQQQMHAQQQPNMANSMSPNHGMSPMHMAPQTPNLQHLAAQNQGMSQQAFRAYQAHQQDLLHRQMNGGGVSNQMMPSVTPNPHGRPMPPQPHPGGGGPMTPQQQRQQQSQQAAAQMQMAFQANFYSNLMKQLIQQYGSEAAVPPEQIHHARQRAILAARQAIQAKQQQMQQRRQQQQQQQQQQQMMAAQMAGGMGGGMVGMAGMNGMNGMGGMHGMQ